MFSKLVSRNSKRNRKENGLFFGSMLAAIIVFHIIVALPRQDLMIFFNFLRFGCYVFLFISDFVNLDTVSVPSG